MKKIKIAGFQKNSFIDYPGKIAAVVFLGGCNFACHYCHNSKLLSAESNTIDFMDEVLPQIREQIGFIDGVVISGGEPTTHPNLLQIVRAVKKLGLLVKLDTNGSNSEILRELTDKKLVDFVAMDIKAPPECYHKIVGTFEIASSQAPRKDAPCLDEIKKSVDYLKSADIDYMFRTTLSPLLTEKDFEKIGELVHGAKLFHVQQFVANDFSNSHSTVRLPHSLQTAKKIEEILAKHCEKVVLRGF